MTPPAPAVTFHISVSQMSVVLSRLTTFLLHAPYAFLQTFHSAEHTDVEVFDQHQQLLVRCTLRVADTDAPVPPPLVSLAQEALAADLVSLLRELVQFSMTTSENRP